MLRAAHAGPLDERLARLAGRSGRRTTARLVAIGSGLKTEYKIVTPGGFYGDETRTGAEEDVVEFGAKAVNMHAYVCVDGVPPQKVWLFFF